MADATQKQILDVVKELLASGAYSDLDITCGEDIHNVHKVIEAKTGTIDLPDDEPSIIKLVIQFLYEGDYDLNIPEGELSETSPILENLDDLLRTTSYARTTGAEHSAMTTVVASKIYEVADKYDIESLKELSRIKFSVACPIQWKNSDQFVLAANHAYTTTSDSDDGLRDSIIGTIANRMTLLNIESVMALLNEDHGLAVGVLEKRAEELGWLKE
ncbi:hypothetical protein K458DRAFT_392828 [Lentithecium fluviatile CBS 122367]|uniref:BTB domain-containing protein n=1 Tax=Lentithecium fluviatile CBS 122367 TaxID=1168545 RepID=A0A6G1IRJ1_9PLEO|nr:hypothetical protein K458DRAFT_392828 [Lentithecium fluviatile CBS 122367]